ncbi:MAG: hypothetical protein IKY98_05865, partial [Alphaproteobacteria bacterium]|nr:hypothetical protein [Alphaproteobacteria bacterium]
MSKDTMPLDTREGPEYDKANFNSINKDIMPLDIWGKPEYDTERVLSHENEKRRNKTKDDKIVFFSLSSSCLTRRSRNHEYRMESGRSMVEMLGVLAVIGVLVIGATMGFEYAMDKYKANEIVHEAGLRASDIFHRYQTVPFPEVGTFGGYENCQNDFAEWSAETQIGYTMNTCAIKDEEGTDLAFAISVKDVPQGVCRRLTDMEPHKYMDGFRYMVIDGNRYTDGRSDICKSETQDVVFVMLLDGEFEECIGDNCGEACIFDDDCRAVCNCAICDKDTKTCILSFTEEGEPQVCNEGICEPTEQCLSGVGF